MSNLDDLQELFQSPDAAKILEWLEEKNIKLLKELLATSIDPLVDFLELKVNAGLQLRLNLQNQNSAMSNTEIINFVTHEVYAPTMDEEHQELQEDLVLEPYQKELLEDFNNKYIYLD